MYSEKLVFGKVRLLVWEILQQRVSLCFEIHITWQKVWKQWKS